MDKPSAEIATQRFGLGARPGEIDAARADPRGWLLEQLGPLGFDAGPGDSAEALRLAAALRARRKARKSAAKKAQDAPAEAAADAPPGKPADDEERRELRALGNSIAAHTLRAAVVTARPFAMRLLDFFSNHFSVTGTGATMHALAPTLEREALAPHLAGSFADMLLAVQRHPAMLTYLSNVQSIGPGSRLGRRRGRGLNENLAREILELHTLGVDGGYRQEDVRELALAITGWSVAKPRRGSNRVFAFYGGAHEPGARQLLGKRYAEGGVEQGEAMLRDLARHPSTARHLAFKLARHMVADDPPPALVEALAARWRETGGDLRAVTEALVAHPAAWEAEARKLKTPREFVVSAARALGQDGQDGDAGGGIMLCALEALGQAPFSAGSPAGFGDVATAWDGAEALLTRIDWAGQIGAHSPRTDPLALARTALGDRLAPATATALGRAASRAQGVALLLMSPEFQRR